jgi:NADH-quinone oxidoreductase subunit C
MTDLLEIVRAAAGTDVTVDTGFGGETFDVAAASWQPVAVAVRDDRRTGADFFDWLSAYDDGEAGFAVVVRAYSTEHNQAVMLRTHLPREAAHLASLTSVWAGANWHERETFEMFGITFDGHPHLIPLLLPDGFEGHPLRKEFVLASRVAKAWPGEKQPGESDRDLAAEDAGRRRRRIRPPGVPAPGTWGPE